jgi:signal peptidase
MKTDSNEENSTMESGNGLIYNQVANDLVLDPHAAGTCFRLEVISGSMQPFLRPGDRVAVQHAAPKDLQIGDLVVARRQGEFITHRLVRIGKNEYYTKGDRSRYLDPPLSKDNMIGRVIEIDRPGRIVDLQTSYWGMMNALLGRINWWEANLFVFLRKVRNRVLRRN